MLRSANPVGVAVIGAGRWGVNYVRDLARLRAAELRWVCDLDSAARQRAATIAPCAAVTGELSRVLGDRRVRAVVIATDSRGHHRHASAALAAGKHVLLEKPLALSLPHAEDLTTLATACGRTLMVGHLMLYHPAVERLRRLVRAGELGLVRHVSAVRAGPCQPAEAGGVLWSLGPHDVSIVDFLLPAAPVRVAARALGVAAATTVTGAAAAAAVRVELADGCRAQLHLSWLEPLRQRRLTVIGTRATAVFDDTRPLAEMLQLFSGAPSGRRPARARFLQLPAVTPLRAQCRHFLRCVVAGWQPRTAAVDHGLQVVRLLAAAQTSLQRDGAPVTLPVETTARPSATASARWPAAAEPHVRR